VYRTRLAGEGRVFAHLQPCMLVVDRN
jgi:hypothetical protein